MIFQASSADAQLALSLCRVASLERLLRMPALTVGTCLERLAVPVHPALADRQAQPVERFYLGNEFCERLLPTPAELYRALDLAEGQVVDLTLVTPILTDAGLGRLEALLAMLPSRTEVVVNDWGTLQRIHEQGRLAPVLGRLLKKMIKDPRPPSAKWVALHPHQGRSPRLEALLCRFGVTRTECDVPPYASAQQLRGGQLPLSVHVPYGYVVKGRTCRIGSSHLDDGRAFSPAHGCRKECLRYWTALERLEAATGELSDFQRGNAQFYRHSSAMSEAWQESERAGWIDRIIVAGDWHEHCRTA